MKQPPILIDTALSASSYRLFFLLLVNIFLLLVILALGFGLWYTLGLVIILLICNYFSQIRTPHLTAISSLRSTSSNPHPLGFLEWQIQIFDGYLFIPYGEQADIYQATLQKIDDFGVVMLLKFEIFEPFNHTINLQIWQDQTDKNSWRHLKILANFQ